MAKRSHLRGHARQRFRELLQEHGHDQFAQQREQLTAFLLPKKSPAKTASPRVGSKGLTTARSSLTGHSEGLETSSGERVAVGVALVSSVRQA